MDEQFDKVTLNLNNYEMIQNASLFTRGTTVNI